MPKSISRIISIGCICLLPVLSPAQSFKYFDAADPASYPPWLSGTGLYLDIAKREMIPAAVKFEINSPLWSDSAVKTRWILLKPGRSVAFRERDDYWGYPDSTVFIKQFAIDTVPGDSSSRILWETRLLINRRHSIDSAGTLMDYWYGLSYKWNREQTDAELISTNEGLWDSLRIYPDGKGKPFIRKKWAFPAAWECNECHYQHNPGGHADITLTTNSRTVLGFFTAQLNRNSSTSPGLNQLEDFFRKGILSGDKPANWETAPRWYGLDDLSNPDSRGGSLDGRVRAYIAANCSGCHGARGLEVGASHGILMNFDFHNLEPQMDMTDYVVGWPGLDSVAPLNLAPGLVVSGHPEKSFLLFRQLARNSDPDDFYPDENQMPPTGTYEVNKVATDSIRKWILEYKPDASQRHQPGMPPSLAPILRGHEVLLPQDMLGMERPKVTLRSLTGRKWVLTPMGIGSYAIPMNIFPGIYILTVGSRNFTRFLF